MNSKSLLKIFALIIGFLGLTSLAFANPVNTDEATAWVNAKGYKLIDTLSNDNIEDKYKFLEDIDKSNEFNSRDWFFFGVVFSTQMDKIKYSEG